MSMQAASLEILEHVDVPSPVARAIVQVFDIEFTEARKELATKQDLVELRFALEAKIAGTHNALEARIASTHSALETKIESSRYDLELKLERFHSGLHVDMAQLKSELMAHIHAARSDGTRQLYVALAAQTALLFGGFYFFFTHMAQ
jgi:hypothetical protein